MTSANWEHANDAWLAARLSGLRARLSQLAGDGIPESAGTSLPEEPAPGEQRLPSALEILGRRLGLSEFEQNVLFLCAAIELDTRVAELCARAQGNLIRAYPTFGLAFALFESPAWDVLSPERPMRRYRLIEISQPGATPLTAAALRADERIVNYVKGLNEFDDRLASLALPFDAIPQSPLVASQQAIADQIAQELEASAADDSSPRLPLIQLVGSDSASKQLIAQHAAVMLGVELIRLPADVLPHDLTESETLLRLWERECSLLPLGLFVDATDAEGRGLERLTASHLRFLARAAGVVFLDTADLRPITGRPTVAFDVAKPTSSEQRQLWQSLLAADRDQPTTEHIAADHAPTDLAGRLAGQFNLNSPSIERIATRCRTSADAQAPLAALWSACRSSCRPRLDLLAHRIDARATWDDLVLPDDELQQLRDIAGQVHCRGRVYDEWGFGKKHNRGLGVSVLFAGESGTGKTMAAEVIANDLSLDLYRIDLSAVVNKYIGETEKNLRKLFDAADDGGAILFFDECDSLFSKRTEVKDSHDRYANLEVNYLLQRLEAYRGLAILATNMKSAIDQAFLRRLRFVVTFPLPDAAQRREMWRKSFPPELPLASLDYDHLARLNITGGNIHTIALNAAFATASSGLSREVHGLRMGHVLHAARSEYRKLQKTLNATDFQGLQLEGSRR